MLLKLCTAPLRILKRIVKTNMPDKTKTSWSSWRGRLKCGSGNTGADRRVENAGVENAGVGEYGKPQE